MMSEGHLEKCPDTLGNRFVTSASVDDIREQVVGRKTKMMFLVSVSWSDGSTFEILKCYKDFFDLQCSVLDEFPVEGGQYNKERIIPFLPGKKIFRKDNLELAQERKPELNIYIKELIKLKSSISQSKLVLDFFKEGQVEIQKSKGEEFDNGSKDCSLEGFTANKDANNEMSTILTILTMRK